MWRQAAPASSQGAFVVVLFEWPSGYTENFPFKASAFSPKIGVRIVFLKGLFGGSVEYRKSNTDWLGGYRPAPDPVDRNRTVRRLVVTACGQHRTVKYLAWLPRQFGRLAQTFRAGCRWPVDSAPPAGRDGGAGFDIGNLLFVRWLCRRRFRLGETPTEGVGLVNVKRRHLTIARYSANFRMAV